MDSFLRRFVFRVQLLSAPRLTVTRLCAFILFVFVMIIIDQTYRVKQVFMLGTMNLSVVRITNCQLIAAIAAIVGIQAGIIIVWTVLSPLDLQVVHDSSDTFWYYSCQAHDAGSYLGLGVFMFFQFILGV